MDQNREELVSTLSYKVVQKTAPEELDIFDDIKEEFIENPDDFMEEASEKKENVLGFGGIGGTFVTVVILRLIWGILVQISKKGIDSFTEEGSKALAKWIIESLFGPKDQTSYRPSIEQLKKIRAFVCRKACIEGLNEEKASIVADSLIGELIGGI